MLCEQRCSTVGKRLRDGSSEKQYVDTGNMEDLRHFL